MAEELLIPLSIKVSGEALEKVFKENPILQQTLDATLKGMESEMAGFVERVITPNARLIEKNIPDYSYSTGYGLDTVIIATRTHAVSTGIAACLESGDLSKLTDFISAELTEAPVRAVMEDVESTIKWMARETKKMGKKKH